MKKTAFKRYFMKVSLIPPFNLPFPAQPFFSVSHPNRPFLLPFFFHFFRFPHLPRLLTSFLRIPFNFLSLFFFFPLLPSSYTTINYPRCPYVPTFLTFLPLPLQFFSSVIPPTFPLTLAFLPARSKSNSRETNIRFITSVRPQATTPLLL